MKRHPLDPLSLVFGVLLAAFGMAFVLAHIDIANNSLRWVWPLPLIGVGALMIALGVHRSSEPQHDVGTTTQIPG